MSRKTRNLIIASIALVAVAGAFFVVRRNDGEAELPERAPTVTTVVLSEIPSADLRSVMVENADGGVHFFSPDGADWQIAETPEYYRLDKAGAVTAVRYVARVQGQEIESGVDESGLAEFGLDTPEATITLREKGGKTTVLEFGVQNPSGSGRFARNADSDTVVLVPSYVTRTATATSSNFRDMSLPTINIETLMAFSYRSGDTVFIAEPRTSIDPFVTHIGPFEIVAPFRGRYALEDYVLSKILAETAPLPVSVREWRDDLDPTDPSLGLDEDSSDYINFFDREGGALALRIGASDGNGRRYAMLADREEAIFILADSDVAFLNTRPFELLSKFVFLASITEVSQIKVETDGETYFMNREERGKEDDSKDDRFTVNNLPLEHEQFTSLYQKFIGIQWEGEITERKTLEFPEVRITATNEAPGVENVVLRFWAYDDTYYQATVGNNPVEFLVGRYQVEKFLEELRALSEYAS